MESTITLGHAVEKQGRLVRELQRRLEVERVRLLAIRDIAEREFVDNGRCDGPQVHVDKDQQ